MIQKKCQAISFCCSLILLGIALSPGTQGEAADFPIKSVQLIAPYAAGGIVDTVGRLVSSKSQEYLGQPMVVVNKPGAGATLGMDFVAKSKPDGYTLGVGSNGPLGIGPAITPNLPYDPIKSFTPVCQLVGMMYILQVRADSQLNTFEKLVDYAKKNPGKLSYGSAGVGSGQHFVGELLQREAGIQMVHVPYKGSSPNVMALLGGHIDLNITTISEAMEQIKAGKFTPLVVTGSVRDERLPQVPSLAEKKYPGAVITGWVGILGPAGLPKHIVDRLANYFQKSLALPDLQTKMKELWLDQTYKGPFEWGKLIESEGKRFMDLAKAANIKVE
ncbi:MAG: tripartite tricarboxylate transporter substrate binding protein [Deltaproteobacteria bacterium]|nr:tripartite tricarboxylate transporter substrate binding protein [Deltaproteobacteria bacterium]